LKYVSLEDPTELAFAEEDPRGFMARFAKGAIFDCVTRKNFMGGSILVFIEIAIIAVATFSKFLV